VLVSRWGNSLAIPLPAAVVDVLGLEEGDEIEVLVAGSRSFEAAQDADAA
jgi:antitoxin MazE